jgi:hypothetical protein
VSELRGEPDLAEEALGPERGGHLGPEHLEPDQARLLEVPGEIDTRPTGTTAEGEHLESALAAPRTPATRRDPASSACKARRCQPKRTLNA